MAGIRSDTNVNNPHKNKKTRINTINQPQLSPYFPLQILYIEIRNQLQERKYNRPVQSDQKQTPTYMVETTLTKERLYGEATFSLVF